LRQRKRGGMKAVRRKEIGTSINWNAVLPTREHMVTVGGDEHGAGGGKISY